MRFLIESKGIGFFRQKRFDKFEQSSTQVPPRGGKRECKEIYVREITKVLSITKRICSIVANSPVLPSAPLRVARPAHLSDDLVNVGALGLPPLKVLVVAAAQVIVGGVALGHHSELTHRVIVQQLR